MTTTPLPPVETTIGRYLKRERSDLDVLAEDITEAHRRVRDAAGTALRYAIEAGELLAEAKAQVPYGQWERWLEQNLPESLSPTHARIYMRLHTYRAQIEGEADSIRAAMALIAGQPNQTGLEAQRTKALAIRQERPGATVRTIADELDVAYATVQGWLNPVAEPERKRQRERARSYQSPRKQITCAHCGGQLYLDGSAASDA